MSRVGTLVVVVVDAEGFGRPEVTDAQGLAQLLRDREFGDYEIGAAYAADGESLAKVTWTVDAGDFDADDYQYVTVKVAFPDGGVEYGHYSIDGRA